MILAHPDRKVQLWFQDEARFGQQGTNSRVWGMRGSRPSLPRQNQHKWTYLFGAACPETGEAVGWLMPVANTEVMKRYLQEMSRELGSDVHALLVLDQAGWHTTSKLAVPENISLLPLPPRSPELNPMETIWRFMRQRYLSNRVFPDQDNLETEVGIAWSRLTDIPDNIRSICNFSWIKQALQPV